MNTSVIEVLRRPVESGLYAATSFGHITNLSAFEAAQELANGGFPQPTIFGRLSAAGISWKYYYGGNAAPFTPGTATLIFRDVQTASGGNGIFPVSQYYTDLANNALPQVTFIDPTFTDSKPTLITNNAPNIATDEHPPSNAEVGQKYMYNILNALWSSSAWGSTAFFLSYDEGGGYYDHVPPPRAVPPDNIPPNLAPGDVGGTFDRFGFRIPVLVISPFANPHYVSHMLADQTSLLKFIETRFGLQPLTRRDAAAQPMLDLFDFSSPSLQKVPAGLTGPPPVVKPCVVLNDLSYGQVLSGGGSIFTSNLSAKVWAGDPSLPLTGRLVEFHLNGGSVVNRVVASVNSPNLVTGNWNASWNTKSVPNGTYSLWAVAFDSAGNSAPSAPILIRVQN